MNKHHNIKRVPFSHWGEATNKMQTRSISNTCTLKVPFTISGDGSLLVVDGKLVRRLVMKALRQSEAIQPSDGGTGDRTRPRDAPEGCGMPRGKMVGRLRIGLFDAFLRTKTTDDFRFFLGMDGDGALIRARVLDSCSKCLEQSSLRRVCSGSDENAREPARGVSEEDHRTSSLPLPKYVARVGVCKFATRKHTLWWLQLLGS